MTRPVVLVVMDGVGYTDKAFGNAVMQAYTPTLDKLLSENPHTFLKAHGEAVGLPSDDDMGNSEVGHNAIGSGQIYAQGAKRVNFSIADGSMFETETWKTAVTKAKDHTMHFIGLLSDGNVHAHVDHLFAMVKRAKADGVKKVRSHILLDGRDVSAISALIYVSQLEAVFAELNDDSFDARIASGGGRMLVTMDRYEAEWSMVELGWKTHVLGEGRQFKSATEAIETFYAEGCTSDQYLPPFVIAEDGIAVGKITDGDVVIFNNFRGDRAIEISKAFEMKDFPYFDRRYVPDVFYAGMLQYDGDLKIPNNFLVEPPHIHHTLTERLASEGINEFAISETQKYGHMTYFWNGNRSEKINEALETWVEIKSDLVPFDQRPWMKAAEITDELIKAVESGKYGFLRCNYPNGDMVGHTGNFLATQISVEAVDLQLARLLEACKKVNAILIVTADHGNADEMYEKQKDPSAPLKNKTSHTLNPVPFVIVGQEVKYKEGKFGLSNIAATVTDLLGIEKDPAWDESLIEA